MNSGRSKLMVGSSGGKMIVNSCCLLPRPMGGKGSHSNFQLFGELHATGVLETLNFCYF